MATINPYLNFPGNTEQAFNFYKTIFGGDFAAIQRFKDTEFGKNLTPAEQEKIMHVSLPIGKNVLMGTDALESMGHKVNAGDNFSITVGPESLDEAHRVFDGLSKGGRVISPLKKEFWGDYFGQLVDPFGIQWMINYHEEQK
ncbi:MAG: VOC family protein [Bacteroidetes bacterium]|nr:MAG: VOC family protein [Bacteroidota bacterium]